MITPDGSDAVVTEPSRRRVRVIVVAIVTLVVVGGLSWWGGSRVSSVQQAAAQAAPPPAALLTAKVVQQVVEDDVVARGTVAASGAVVIAPPLSAPSNGVAMVTAMKVKPGSDVKNGSAVAEISGRPVFLLKGDVPLYRDITPGDTGSDVAELQKALAEAGFHTGPDKAGRYGFGTQTALRKLYEKSGYTAQSSDGAAWQATAPRSELVMVPALPARVVGIDASVGAVEPKQIMRISGGPLIVRSDLSGAGSAQIRNGTSVSIDQLPSGDSGASVPGTVGSVTTSPDSGDGSGGGPTAMVVPSTPLPAAAEGADVRVTFVTARSDGAVLAVPLAAISSRDDGSALVTVVHGDQTADVVVTPGVQGSGLVEVAPIDGDLKAGDSVLLPGSARS